MESNEKEKLLRQYEYLKDALDLINENTPELQKLYEATSSQLDDYKTKIENEIAQKDKAIKTLQKKIADASKMLTTQVDELNHRLMGISTAAKAIEEMMPDIDVQLKELTRTNQDLLLRLEKVEKEILKKNSKNTKPKDTPAPKRSNRVKVDYDEEMTVKQAYEKYYGKVSPLIVAGKKWNSDYCFIITGIQGESANGFTFRLGKIYHTRDTIALTKMVHIYNGPSQKAIEQYYDENINIVNIELPFQ